MSLLELVDIVNRMGRKHIEALRAVERASFRFEYVPLQYLSKKTSMKSKMLVRVLDWLVSYKLLRKKVEKYIGYALTYKGADALAIIGLSRYGVITKVGSKIGMGKDGDIWIAYLDNNPRILKLFHISKRRFRNIRFYRGYILPRKRITWLEISKILARHEFRALSVLYQGGVNVPMPIARNRHLIVMDYIEGKELIKVNLSEPLLVFERIIRELAKALSIGLVHGDLSEYNILITENEEPYIIDWPQYIPRTDPLAIDYLNRDVNQLVKYFARKYRINANELIELVNKEFEKEGVMLTFES